LSPPCPSAPHNPPALPIPVAQELTVRLRERGTLYVTVPPVPLETLTLVVFLTVDPALAQDHISEIPEDLEVLLLDFLVPLLFRKAPILDLQVLDRTLRVINFQIVNLTDNAKELLADVWTPVLTM